MLSCQIEHVLFREGHQGHNFANLLRSLQGQLWYDHFNFTPRSASLTSLVAWLSTTVSACVRLWGAPIALIRCRKEVYNCKIDQNRSQNDRGHFDEQFDHTCLDWISYMYIHCPSIANPVPPIASRSQVMLMGISVFPCCFIFEDRLPSINNRSYERVWVGRKTSPGVQSWIAFDRLVDFKSIVATWNPNKHRNIES